VSNDWCGAVNSNVNWVEAVGNSEFFCVELSTAFVVRLYQPTRETDCYTWPDSDDRRTLVDASLSSCCVQRRLDVTIRHIYRMYHLTSKLLALSPFVLLLSSAYIAFDRSPKSQKTLAAPERVGPPQSHRFKIRTITAGINLKNTSDLVAERICRMLLLMTNGAGVLNYFRI